MKWTIWFGFPRDISTVLSQAKVSAVRRVSRPNNQLWPSGLISRPAGIGDGSHFGTSVFAEDVLLVGTSHDTDGAFWHRPQGLGPVEPALLAKDVR